MSILDMIINYCYIVICWFMQKYTYICWIHTDAMITDARRKTQWQRQTQEDFFIKYFTSHFICKVSKRVTQSLHVRGSWRPNITEIFWPPKLWPSALCFSSSPWLLNRSPGFPYYISSLSDSNYTACPQLYSPVSWLVKLNCPLFNSSALSYLQIPTQGYGHASSPPEFLPMSGDWDVSLPLSLEWPVWSSSSRNNCHAVQRSLSSGASVYESIMGFFFTSSHFISQFPPTRFPLITAIRMCHFLLVRHLEWHFWPAQNVKT